MSRRHAVTCMLVLLGLVPASCSAPTSLPAGYFSRTECRAILDKTGEIHLSADLSRLDPAERRALNRLLEAGPIFEQIYERSRHYQALQAYNRLVELDQRLHSPPATRDLLRLYRLFQGPIATTLSNRRVPFLPVIPEVPGKNLYPVRADTVQLAAYVRKHPEALGPRNLVRVALTPQVEADLAALDRHPELTELHPTLRAQLEHMKTSLPEDGFYLVPYSIEYADDLAAAHDALSEAAAMVDKTDPAFAGYLRLRAHDLLSDDYSPGDSAWVTSRFRNLNAQIGSYETYDDALYGVKTSFGMSLLVRDGPKSDAIAKVTSGLQALENALPYAPHHAVREDIPVGVYDVVADFGQTRGLNTATILPNESRTIRKFGRTILLRANIMTDPHLLAEAHGRLGVVLDSTQAGALDVEGDFNRTLWHEIGHYLGPQTTADGHELDEAFTDRADLLEEMKADLIALFAGRSLRESGYYDDAGLRSLYVGGVRRVLLRVRPRRDEPYGSMQLIQFNYFLENGLLSYDASAKRLRIDFAHYHDVVASLLARVLSIQERGDRAGAEALIARYSSWEPEIHEALAARMRAVETHRYHLVYYTALGE